MKRRVFVTGATGYVGGAVAARLVRAGHEVHGLTRSADKAASLEAAGVRPVVAALDQFALFEGALRNSDVVVHTASDPKNAAVTDQQALSAIRTAAQDGRVRRLIYTSGAWVHGDTGSEVADESRPLAPLPLVKWRAAHEDVARDLAEFEVEVIVMRLTTVYGETRGSLSRYFREARDRRTVTIPGTGAQHWSLVHRDDVAEAYALALEHGTGGETFDLCDEATYTAGQIGEAIAKAAGAELRFWDAESVRRELGDFGEALLTSLRVTSAKARRDLGWVPRHPSFLREVDALHREWVADREAPVA